MAKQLGTAVENTFIQGLITEATGLNFPDKAVTETDNVRYNKKGNVTRRLGINHEAGYLAAGDAATGDVSRAFVWNGVGFEGQRTFLVTQSGTNIYFYEAQSGGIYSSGKKDFEIDLMDYGSGASNVDIGTRTCSFAYGLGKLFIVHPYVEPLYVEFDEELDDIVVTAYDIKIRDFEGVPDDLDIDERPAVLTGAHKYNLWNQGWWERKVDGSQFPINAFRQAGKGHPSNCDVWWYYKGAEENFDRSLIDKIDIGNSEAPKGHYIYSLFDMDRSDITGIPDLPARSTNGIRPSTVAFYAGRVWYGGINVPEFSNNVYYTQIIERDEQIGKCYQQNDPTSEDLSDLLDSDGGEVKIPEMGSLTTFFTMKNNLILMATNGIWLVSGSGAEGTGFVATDFAISRVSNTSCPSNLSLVEAEGAPFWWNFDGIWVIQPNQMGSLAANNLSNDTIKTFYQEIAPENRIHAQGAYNPLERTIQWVYRSTTSSSTEDRFTYDRILELNLTTGSFSPFSWESSDQRISSIFCAANAGVNRALFLERVYDSSNVVVTVDNAASAGAVTPESAFITYGSSSETASNSPAGFRHLGGNPFIYRGSSKYVIYNKPSHDLIQVYEVDTTADTFILRDSLTAGSLWGRMNFTALDLSGLDEIDNVGCANIQQLDNTIVILGINTKIGDDTLFYLTAEINEDGQIELTGGHIQAVTDLGINKGPSTWKDISQMGTNGTGPIMACSIYQSSVSGAPPRMWLLPPPSEVIGGWTKSTSTSIGNGWVSDISDLGAWFTNHASYRPVFSNAFSLPISATRSYYYFTIGPSDTQAHLNNGGYYSDQQTPFIDYVRTIYPTGMIYRLPINISTVPSIGGAGTWNINDDLVAVPTLFQDDAGNPNFPFSDSGRTAYDLGAANTNFYGDWQPRPSVVKVGSDWYILWGQLLESKTFNMYVGNTTNDALARGRIFEYTVGDETAVQKDNWEFIPFNWDTDFPTWAASTTFYPRTFQLLYDVDTGKIYAHGDVVGGTTYHFFCTAGEFVVTIVSEAVTVPRYADQNPPATKFKYIGMSDFQCILEEQDTKYVDFRTKYLSEGGKNYESYFLTGAKIPGNGDRSSNIEYVTVFGNAVNNASCFMRAKWDWSNDSSTGKWSTEQQTYTVNRDNRDVSRKRLLVRGSGPALQLQFRSEDGKPFDLIGWTIWMGVDSAA